MLYTLRLRYGDVTLNKFSVNLGFSDGNNSSKIYLKTQYHLVLNLLKIWLT